jgi:KDO2-lipid IV(A) lauroyltransferase
MSRVLLIKFLLYAMALLPLPAVHALGSLLGRAGYRYAKRMRRVVRINLELCFPGLSEQEREDLAKQSFQEIGKTMLETGPIWLWSIERVMGLIRKVSGQEHMEAAIKSGKGAIIVSPHLGAWEIVGHYFAKHHSMTVLYRPPRMKALEGLMVKSRKKGGCKLAATDARGVRTLFKALSQGELVGILPDQDPGREAGVFAPFFGVPTNTMALLPRLAHKTGAPVLMAYAQRLPKGKGYHLHIQPVPDCVHSADTMEATTCLNQGVEDCIKSIPEQYQWGYKRFRTRPVGEKKIY